MVRLADRPDMTIALYRDVKLQHNNIAMTAVPVWRRGPSFP